MYYIHTKLLLHETRTNERRRPCMITTKFSGSFSDISQVTGDTAFLPNICDPSHPPGNPLLPLLRAYAGSNTYAQWTICNHYRFPPRTVRLSFRKFCRNFDIKNWSNTNQNFCRIQGNPIPEITYEGSNNLAELILKNLVKAIRDLLCK